MPHKGEVGGYRGPDRRRIAAQELPWTAPVAGTVIFVVTIAVASRSTELPASSVSTMLTSAAFMGSVLLAVTSGLTWRASGRAAPLWLAMTATAYTLVLATHLGTLVPGLLWASAEPGLADTLASASRVAAVVGLMCAALWYPVDTRLGVLRTFVAGGAVLALAAGLFALVPEARAALLSQAHMTLAGGLAPSSQAVPESLAVILPTMWGLVAGVLAAQAHRRHDPVLAWATLLALTLGGAEALQQLVGTSDSFVAAELARSAGLIAATVGVSAGVGGLAGEHRRALGTAAQASKAAEGRLKAADTAQAELRHEAQNALTAVHAAAATLHAHHEFLAPDDRAELSGAVSREIERLRLLLDSPGSTGTLVPVRLAEAVGPAVVGARAQGVTVHVDVPSHQRVLAREYSVTQIVSVLLDNARKHAPGSPVWLRADLQADGVVMRCADRGPGIPPEERQEVFHRGQRGRNATGEGSGLGLAVVARLMCEQGGTVWADEHPGGGASIALWFAPALQEGLPPGARPGQRHDHQGETEEGEAVGIHGTGAPAPPSRARLNGDAASQGRQPRHLRLWRLPPFRHRSS